MSFIPSMNTVAQHHSFSLRGNREAYIISTGRVLDLEQGEIVNIFFGIAVHLTVSRGL